MLHQALRQVVELQVMVIHGVHKLPIFGVCGLLPHLLPLPGLAIDQVHGLVPPPLDLIGDLVFARIYIAVYFEVVGLGPASLVKFNVHVLVVGTGHVSEIATALGIQVGRPDDQVVHTQDRLLEEETLFKRLHFNVLREDIIDG